MKLSILIRQAQQVLDCAGDMEVLVVEPDPERPDDSVNEWLVEETGHFTAVADGKPYFEIRIKP